MVNKHFFLCSALLLQCCIIFSMKHEIHPLFCLPKEVQNKILKYVIEDNKIDVKLSEYKGKAPADSENKKIYRLNFIIKNKIDAVVNKTFQNNIYEKNSTPMNSENTYSFEGLMDNKVFFDPKTRQLTFSIKSNKCKERCFICTTETTPYIETTIFYILRIPGIIHMKSKKYKKYGKEVPPLFEFSSAELELINFNMNDNYLKNHLRTYFHIHQICKNPNKS